MDTFPFSQISPTLTPVEINKNKLPILHIFASVANFPYTILALK